jgi:hypothetical protein
MSVKIAWEMARVNSIGPSTMSTPHFDAKDIFTTSEVRGGVSEWDAFDTIIHS